MTFLSMLAVGALSGCGSDATSEGDGVDNPIVVIPGDPKPTDPVDQPTVQCDADGVRQARVWRLSPIQLANTAESVMPGVNLSIDALEATVSHADQGFSTNASRQVFSTPHIRELVELADDFAAHAVERRESLASCLRGEAFERACLSSFLDSFLTKAFRRPATQADIEYYIQFFNREAGNRSRIEAFRQTVRGIFLSTHFLFRTETGPDTTGVAPMGPYERASALSYILYDGPPDATLMAAARAGELSTSEQLATQVRRLIASQDHAQGVIQFLSEFFGVGNVLSSEKDAQLYPTWNANLAKHFLGESVAFFEEVLFRDDARFSTLLTAGYAMVNDSIAPHYGLSPVGSNDYVRRTLPAGQRAGILSQAAFLAPISGFSEPDITKRGHYIREKLMCQKLPPVPEGIPPLPDVAGLSRRERLETIHAADPVCNACHRLMDPLGYAFEHYDSLGRWRDTENVGGSQIPVNSQGTIVGGSSGDQTVVDAVDLAQVFSNLPEVQACFVHGLAEYLAGDHDSAVDSCRLEKAIEGFLMNSGDVIELVVQLLSDENFYLRQTHSNAAPIASPTIEAEHFDGLSPAFPFVIQQDGGRTVVVWPMEGQGVPHLAAPSDDGDGQVFYTVIPSATSMTLHAVVNFPRYDQDSLYFKLEGAGDWRTINNVATEGYQEVEFGSWSNLVVGRSYTLKIQRRENGAKLDSLRVEGGNFLQ